MMTEPVLTPEKVEEALGIIERWESEKKSRKESEEDIRKRARKPPKDGPCRRCGRDLPLNRLFLCYGCWTKTVLEEHGWREGQPHPEWCVCEVECKIERGGFS